MTSVLQDSKAGEQGDSGIASRATAKERFDLLYGRLRYIHDTFIDVVFKATAAFLIVTGWAATSETARGYLRGDFRIAQLAVLGFSIYALLFAGAAYRTASVSSKLLKQIATLEYMPAEHYKDVVVRPFLAAVFAIANSLLAAAAAVFIVCIAG
jgi:hypothetical protein